MEAIKHTIAPLFSAVNLIRGGACLALLGITTGLLLGDVELNLANYATFSYFSVAIGMATLFAVAVCVLFPIAGRAIRYTVANPKQVQTMFLLESGINTAGDVLIRTEGPRESPAVIADKLAAQIEDDPAIWGAFFQFRNPVALLFDGTGQPKEFERTTGPEGYEYQLSAHDRKTESWSEYEADLKNFFRPWPEWVKEQKWNSRPKTVQSFIEAARTAYTILALCLVPFVVSGQNITAQVRTYLGEVRFSTDKPNGQIIFRFEKGDIPREGRGRTYEQMLPDNPYFKDSNTTGKLKEVLVGGQRVEPARQVAQVNVTLSPQMQQAYVDEKASRAEQARMVRPASLESIPVATGFESLATDSLSITQKMEGAKEKVERWKRAGWAAALPIWQFFMYLFGSVFCLLLCAGGLFWYVADSATDETYIGYHGQTYTGKLARSAHESAAGWLLLITWTCFIVLLINVFLWLVYAGLDMWLVVVLWFIALGISSRITKKIVPNIKRLSKGTGIQPA